MCSNGTEGSRGATVQQTRERGGGGQAPNYKGMIKDKGKKSKCNVCQDQCYHLLIAIQQMGKTKAQEGGKTGN